MGLSLITEKHLEMNGKRPADIRIQRRTGQTRNFSKPILDTRHSASVRTGCQGPGLGLGKSPVGQGFPWVLEEVLRVVAILRWASKWTRGAPAARGEQIIN